VIEVAVSPCSNPDLTLEECFREYGRLGYRRFELFTGWCRSHVTADAVPQPLLDLAARHGFAYSSIHLPALADDLAASLDAAERTARLGAALGCRCAIVKAKTRDLFADGTPRLLDAIDDLPIVPVVQNHKGTAITTLDDCLEVLERVGDPRLACLLEVGHFHSVGVSWLEGCEALAGRIRHVHIKDQVGSQSVPFGVGEIDLPGLFARLVADGYEGDIVVEMEVADRENTLAYLGDALSYIEEHWPT
jgi:sugar phosphate isomerase/epimerase